MNKFVGLALSTIVQSVDLDGKLIWAKSDGTKLAYTFTGEKLD